MATIQRAVDQVLVQFVLLGSDAATVDTVGHTRRLTSEDALAGTPQIVTGDGSSEPSATTPSATTP